MQDEVAGDPISGLKWTRKTTAKIAAELQSLDIQVCPNTVGKLLKELGFSLRVNHKKLGAGSPQDRDEQFAYIAELRKQFTAEEMPVVSVDTKKKELVGRFKNPGTAWHYEPISVNDHDFRSIADGIAIPYGIYDVKANCGAVFVGTSHDTPEFATDCLAAWWQTEGRHRYPKATKILILADGGGSNAAVGRGWKVGLHRKLVETHGLSVTVCHYPPGASKWNPIEHRLFSEVSKNWAGRPLDSYETIMNYLQTTITSTGLKVTAYLNRTEYPTGLKISDGEFAKLNLSRHSTQPKRNYTLSPKH